MIVNKKEIATYIGINHGLSKKASEAIIEDIFLYIADTLTTGTEVNIKDFGKFAVKTRAARICRNPANGEPVHMAEKIAPVFKASAYLKASLNGKLL